MIRSAHMVQATLALLLASVAMGSPQPSYRDHHRSGVSGELRDSGTGRLMYRPTSRPSPAVPGMAFPSMYIPSTAILYGDPNDASLDHTKPQSEYPDFHRMNNGDEFSGTPPMQTFPRRVIFRDFANTSTLAHSDDRGFTTIPQYDNGLGVQWDLRWAAVDPHIQGTNINYVPVFQMTLNGNNSCVTSRALDRIPDPNDHTKVTEYHQIGAVPTMGECNMDGFADIMFPNSAVTDEQANANKAKLDLNDPDIANKFDKFASTLWFTTDVPNGPDNAFHINSYQAALHGLWTCLHSNGGLYACENDIGSLQWTSVAQSLMTS
ncbi:hypothetical protein BJ684DRAFT_14627 [Piptocephalis cylindrospora]|uniref:Uncharacterized protein n=1 Tax=Piptocephalis cylindrospora TaxID=1907219 RepID=A0A4P9YAI8_9FUNG|nr:hypothetical protein BJ684DRAFT_14627 [Piptocephalis cylindrospora]|eukprot:RKP15100.1 hypothetical protein BJ684DRAFT_14627 [Piptocephalis cylindrospora]